MGTDDLMIGVLAVDRAGVADDDCIGGFDAGGEGVGETVWSSRSVFLAASVGVIGCAGDGAAGRAGVGDNDGLCAAIVGFETDADLNETGLSTEPSRTPESDVAWLEKAECRSAVIRSYIRLGFVLADSEDVLAAVVKPETFVVLLIGVIVAGCRIVSLGTTDVGFSAPTAVCPLMDF